VVCHRYACQPMVERMLASEQAALRRVATLVARGVAPESVFAAVTEEIGRLLAVEYVEMGRYEPDGTLIVVGAWGTSHLPIGSRWKVGGKNLAAIVLDTGRPARIDRYADASGQLGVAARDKGVHAAAATPIRVEGRVWGVVITGSLCPGTPRCASRSSPSWSQPRSEMPRAVPDSSG
jgi:GAF domain-containing protein